MKPILTADMKNTWDTLNLIEHAEPWTTRATIAKLLNLSRTTVSIIVSQLIAYGLVEEFDTSATGRGRPGIPLKLSISTWNALGASFHGDQWQFLLVNLLGQTVLEHREQLEAITIEQFIEKLLCGLDFMIAAAPKKLLPLIGIGTPGLVDSNTGIITRADDLGWKRVKIGEMVTEHTGFPCYAINRHRAAGLAEVQFGIGRGIRNLIYIGIDTGISAAFINDGILLEGANFSAGEIGHLLIDPNGPLCGCGRYGCLQAFSSSQALIRLMQEKYRSLIAFGDEIEPNLLWKAIEEQHLTGDLIASEANKGNKFAIAGMKKIAVQLGIAVSNLINTMNPQKIIIGGVLGNTGPFLADLIRQEAAIHAMASPFSTVNIEMSVLGNSSGALGAASIPLRYKLELVIQASKND
ncbi:MAG: ROK family transcriptional regulator [Sphaerochaeta sp.]